MTGLHIKYCRILWIEDVNNKYRELLRLHKR